MQIELFFWLWQMIWLKSIYIFGCQADYLHQISWKKKGLISKFVGNKKRLLSQPWHRWARSWWFQWIACLKWWFNENTVTRKLGSKLGMDAETSLGLNLGNAEGEKWGLLLGYSLSGSVVTWEGPELTWALGFESGINEGLEERCTPGIKLGIFERDQLSTSLLLMVGVRIMFGKEISGESWKAFEWRTKESLLMSSSGKWETSAVKSFCQNCSKLMNPPCWSFLESSQIKLPLQ